MILFGMIVKQLEEQDKSSWPDNFLIIVMWANRRATSILQRDAKMGILANPLK